MKKYNITVNGTTYEVVVEEADGSVAAPVYTAPAAAAPVAAPAAPKAAPKTAPIKKSEKKPAAKKPAASKAKPDNEEKVKTEAKEDFTRPDGFVRVALGDDMPTYLL